MLIAAVVLWRRGQRTILALLVMPMGVALAVAALKLYPYGGQARIMQYIAPAVCLMAGLGLSTLLGWLPGRPAGPRRSGSRPSPWPPRESSRWRTTSDIRTGPSTTIRPASSPADSGPSRPGMPKSPACSGISGSRRGMSACPHGDLPVQPADLFPAPASRRRAALDLVTPERPLRCVAFDDAIIKSPAATAWLESIETRYTLRKRVDLVVPTIGLDMKPWNDHVRIFEFQPKPARPAERVAEGIPDPGARG